MHSHPLELVAIVMQVCTGVMLHSYSLVKTLCGGLQVMAGLRPH